jgi:hypothetical protein
MTNEIELRLIDAAAPNGEVAVKDLAALATALQELTTRISRDVINTPGPGRTKQFMEEVAQLRLRAVEASSTVLRFSKGPVDKLDVDLPEEAVADDRFWEIVQAMAEDRRPDWVSDLIAESVAKLVSAFQAAAPSVIVGASSRGEVRVSSATTHVETWTTSRVNSGAAMSAAGRLEKVDLRSHEFRLRDDVDNTVDLKRVESDTVAAQLVGQWVVAQGIGILHASGRLAALENARVFQAKDPAADYVGGRVVTREEILASAPGPDPNGGLDLSEDEMIAFLQALRS